MRIHRCGYAACTISLANSRTSAAAGISLHPDTFCPAHSGEKSPLPLASALARNGAIADVANGNAGRCCADRTHLADEAVDNAACGAAGEYIGQRSDARGIGLERGPMNRGGGRFGAEQVGRADLDTRGAQRHRRGNPVRVGDAAGRDDRDSHRLHDLRQQRERADLRRKVIARETCRDARPLRGPARSWHRRRGASSQRASSTVVAEERIFAPHARTRASKSATGRPKWKLTTGGLEFLEHVRRFRVERRAPGPGGIVAGSMPSSS